jgi:5-methylcytosine-specific restriction protein A
MCKSEGRVTAATVVDHRVKHEGNDALMWDQANWQPLCKTHHDSAKQALEKSGRVMQVIGEDGWPLEASKD